MTTATVGREVDLQQWRAAGALLLAGGLMVPVLPDGVVPGCPLRALTGIPCPLCGMTTSVTATVHLDLPAATAAAPAGIVAVVVAVALLLSRRRAMTVPSWTAGATVAAMWAWQLGRVVL